MAEEAEGKSTVRQKIAAIKHQEKVNATSVAKIETGIRHVETEIKNKTHEVNAAVAQIGASIKALEKTNAAAVDKIYKGVAALQDKIAEQEKVNRAAVREIDAGARQIVSATNKMAGDFQVYIKAFWG